MSNKSENIRAPHSLDKSGNSPTAVDGYNDFGVIVFSVGTTHAAYEIPSTFWGKYISIYCSGGNVAFGFSTNANAEVSVTTTTNNTQAKIGGQLANGIANKEHYVCPYLTASSASTKLYLIAESDTASTSLWIQLTSA